MCLGGWPVGIRAQPDLANIRGFCWEPGGSHPALFGEIVDCYPDTIAPDLVTWFWVLSAYRGFCVSFVQPLSRSSLSDPGEMINDQ